MTRRSAISMALAGAGLPLLAQRGVKRTTPSICVLSKALSGVGYAELGDIVKQLGFDGVDLTVMPGGHVEPSQAPVDEVRAFESLHGAGLEVPIITTGFTTPAYPWTRTVIALAGRTGVGLFKCGVLRLAEARRSDLIGLVEIAREYKVGLTLAAGHGGTAPELDEALAVVQTLDPDWSGLCLRSDCFSSVGSISDEELAGALPFVRAISLFDFDGASREARPLGKGAVDIGRLFVSLARAGFTGPISVERSYRAKDEPGALAADAEFARRQMQAAYGALKS